MNAYPKYRYIPKGSTEHKDDDLSAVWYTEETERGVFAIGYSGKRTKPDFNYRYPSIARRDQHINGWLAGLREYAKMQAERKENRKLTENPFKVGDIFHHSWGYDQTQCDYYQVVRTTKATVVIRPIASRMVPGSDGFMCCMELPVPDSFIKSEPEITKKVQRYVDNNKQEHFHLSFEYGSCTPWDDGKPNYHSWYA